jgi:phosphatidylinositol 3-kinase
VWPNQEADGNFPSSTPGKARDHGKEQMQRLAKVYFYYMYMCCDV